MNIMKAKRKTVLKWVVVVVLALLAIILIKNFDGFIEGFKSV